MSLSLVICFYRDVAMLTRTLDTVALQSRPPDEVIVADDGSDESMGEAIAAWSNRRQVPVTHVWHPKDGFRLSEIRNKAAFVAQNKFVSYIDHDCLIPRGFVSGHLAMANERHLQLGPRIDVMPPTSHKFTPSLFPILSGWVSRHLAGWRTALRGGEVGTSPPEIIQGCNLLVPRNVMHEINGFDEDYKSWGYEDADFVIRAWHSGVGMGLSGYPTTVFHIFHPSNSQPGNKERFDECVARRRTRCENGISKHSGAAVERSTNGSYTRVAFPY